MKVINKDLKRRIIELSHKYKLSHIGSCLTAVDIIDEIFQTKKSNERFVLSSGHAGLALYVVIEKYLGKDAEEIWRHHGVHPDSCRPCHLDCSTGSLGNGLPISLGMAITDRSKNVYCLISDGECAEGSITESLHFKYNYKVNNLKIYLNYNGWGAYSDIQSMPNYHDYGVEIIKTNSDQLPFLRGLDAHYHVMTDEEYRQAMEILK